MKTPRRVAVVDTYAGDSPALRVFKDAGFGLNHDESLMPPADRGTPCNDHGYMVAQFFAKLTQTLASAIEITFVRIFDSKAACKVSYKAVLDYLLAERFSAAICSWGGWDGDSVLGEVFQDMTAKEEVSDRLVAYAKQGGVLYYALGNQNNADPDRDITEWALVPCGGIGSGALARDGRMATWSGNYAKGKVFNPYTWVNFGVGLTCFDLAGNRAVVSGTSFSNPKTAGIGEFLREPGDDVHDLAERILSVTVTPTPSDEAHYWWGRGSNEGFAQRILGVSPPPIGRTGGIVTHWHETAKMSVEDWADLNAINLVPGE